jgi:hypothetical protein
MMDRRVAWGTAAVVATWIAWWGARGGPAGEVVLLQWPAALILLGGYAGHLRAGLVAAALASLGLAGLAASGAVGDWRLVGWSVLVFAVFGLYPFKFIQIREQRHHYYRTLIEYKRGELEALRRKTADADARVRELERRLRGST